MAWTTPRTWVSSEFVTAALLNTHIRDNLVDLDTCNGFRATAPGSQSVTTATITLVQFTVETFDANAWYDAVTNFRYQPSRSGKHYISANVGSSNVQNAYKVSIYKNGVLFSRAMHYHPTATGDVEVHHADIVIFNGSSDYVDIRLEHTLGSSATVISESCFSGYYIGA